MIGTVLLIGCMAGAIGGLVYRRGGRPWSWMALAVIGYGVLHYLGWQFDRSDLGELLGVLWLLVLFPFAYLAPAGLRRARGHWQCPDCRCFNRPSTLVCDCGYRMNEEPCVTI